MATKGTAAEEGQVAAAAESPPYSGLSAQTISDSVNYSLKASCTFEDGVPKALCPRSRGKIPEEVNPEQGQDATNRPSFAPSISKPPQDQQHHQLSPPFSFGAGDGESVVVGIRLPGLSLEHEKGQGRSSSSGEEGHGPTDERKQVEEFAAALLARSIEAYGKNRCSNAATSDDVDETPPPATEADNEKTGRGDAVSSNATVSLSLLPVRVLENVTESFATLVACRLRAYAMFLARHGIALAKTTATATATAAATETEDDGGGNEDAVGTEGVLSVEQKLNMLIDIGGNIAARSLHLEFRAGNGDDEDEDEDMCLLEDIDEDTETGNVAKSQTATSTPRVPVTLHVRIEVEIPMASGSGKKILPVTISAPGQAVGTSERKPPRPCCRFYPGNSRLQLLTPRFNLFLCYAR